MQIIENWTDLAGVIKRISDSEIMPDYLELQLEVHTILDVDQYPNLLGDTLKKTITIFTSPKLFEEVQKCEGKILCARVRKASQQKIFSHPTYITIFPPPKLQ